MSASELPPIAQPLLTWWDATHDPSLPWRKNRDPYRVWVSEIMLQQTQITTVIPYYKRWMAAFPSVGTLAAASLDAVLKQWEGLGYYSRARNLHASAQIVVAEYGGKLPTTRKTLQKLKGIGPYTAAAIASQCFGERTGVVDGDVIRVLTRLQDIADDVTKGGTKHKLQLLADGLVPTERSGDYNQALMELGQRRCKPAKPQCGDCPVSKWCVGLGRGTTLNRPVRPPRKRIPHYPVAAAIIHRADGRFLIAQRPLNGLLGGLWEFPGGKQEASETLLQTIKREIMEELGIEINVTNAEPLAVIPHAFTHFRITLHAFHCRQLGDERVQHIGIADHAWVTLADLPRYAFAHTDRQIIAALHTQS